MDLYIFFTYSIYNPTYCYIKKNLMCHAQHKTNIKLQCNIIYKEYLQKSLVIMSINRNKSLIKTL